jgi:capping protein alpha
MITKRKIINQILQLRTVRKILNLFLATFHNGDDGKWNMSLLISAHNLNHKNFWCGEWLSAWNLQKEDETNYSLKGSVRANTYYYEEGNIQFNLKSDFSEKLQSQAEDEQLIKDVIALIEKNENKIQIDLDQVYDNFSDHYIKPLRRKLPVTGSKMNWSLNQIGLNK